MTTVHYVAFDGQSTTVDVPEETTLMQAALNNNIKGIFAECGGQAECATCHVYVDHDYLDRLPEMSPDEDEMLDGTAAERYDNSRLACQIPLTADLDGLIAHLPELQR